MASAIEILAEDMICALSDAFSSAAAGPAMSEKAMAVAAASFDPFHVFIIILLAKAKSGSLTVAANNAATGRSADSGLRPPPPRIARRESRLPAIDQRRPIDSDLGVSERDFAELVADARDQPPSPPRSGFRSRDCDARSGTLAFCGGAAIRRAAKNSAIVLET